MNPSTPPEPNEPLEIDDAGDLFEGPPVADDDASPPRGKSGRGRDRQQRSDDDRDPRPPRPDPRPAGKSSSGRDRQQRRDPPSHAASG